MVFVFVCVSMLWIFFKLPNFDHAIGYLTGMFTPGTNPNPTKLFYNLALLYSLPVMIQHLVSRELFEGRLRRVEPYLYGSMLTLMYTHAPVALNLRKLVEQPPSDFDSRVYTDRAFQQFEAEDPADMVRTNAKRIEELIGKVERRGARVVLFELPYSAPIEGSRAAIITREIYSQRDFPIRPGGCAST